MIMVTPPSLMLFVARGNFTRGVSFPLQKCPIAIENATHNLTESSYNSLPFVFQIRIIVPFSELDFVDAR